MSQDLVVKLLLRTGAFSTDLKTAKGQIQSFKTEMGKVGTAVNTFSGSLGSVSKLISKAGPWGAAATAIAGVGKAFVDSGIYADQFEVALNSAGGALDSLKFNLANFSWDNFIGDAITAAKVVRDATVELDNLNTVLGANAPVKNVAWDRYQTALTKAQDRGYSKEQRLAFLKQAEDYSKVYLESVRTELNSGEGIIVQEFKKYLGDVWGTFSKLSNEEQKKLMTQGASGQWGFNDALEAAKKAAQDAKIANQNLARQVVNGSDSRRLDAQKAEDEAEAYYKLLKKLVSLENKAGKKPEILKNFQELSEIFHRGGDIVDLTGTIDELIEKTEVSIGKELSNTKLRIDNGIGDTSTTRGRTRGESEAEKAKKELDRALQAYNEYSAQLTRDLMSDRDRELAIEEEKYEAMKATAEKYGWDITDITEKYNQKVAAINQKYAAKEAEDAAKVNLVNKYLSDTAKEARYSTNELNTLIGVFTIWANDLKEGDPQLQMYATHIKELTERLKELKKELTETNEQQKESENNMSDASAALDAYKKKVDEIMISLNAVSGMFSSLSVLAGSFGTATGDAFATVLDSLSTVANGIMQFVQIQEAAAMASGTASASALPFPYNLAAIATVVSTVAAVFAKIVTTAKSAHKFANGGIVGGNSYTGDRVTANVNSGEMILNRTQQARLFQMINNGGSAGGQVEFQISGTNLYGVLNNYNKKMGLVR